VKSVEESVVCLLKCVLRADSMNVLEDGNEIVSLRGQESQLANGYGQNNGDIYS